MREREAQMMLKHIENLKAEEVKLAKLKQERAAVMMTEVEAANHEAIAVKAKKIMEEKELEQKIVEYNKNKAMREEEEAAEKRRIQQEKERET